MCKSQHTFVPHSNVIPLFSNYIRLHSVIRLGARPKAVIFVQVGLRCSDDSVLSRGAAANANAPYVPTPMIKSLGIHHCEL